MESIKVFTAKACFAPLNEAARLYEKERGVRIETLVCGRACADAVAKDTSRGHEIVLGQPETFLLEIGEIPGLDVAIAGAEYLFDDGEDHGIILGSTRRSLGLRESAILVGKGNPHGIRGLRDLIRPGLRVGVSVIDCLKGMWEDICGRERIIEKVRGNITTHLTGCVAITQAVAEGKVDAGFGWTTFKALAGGGLDVVPLPPDQRVYRSTSAAVMKQSRNAKAAGDFIGFLASEAGKAIYERHGWIAER